MKNSSFIIAICLITYTVPASAEIYVSPNQGEYQRQIERQRYEEIIEMQRQEIEHEKQRAQNRAIEERNNDNLITGPGPDMFRGYNNSPNRSILK